MTLTIKQLKRLIKEEVKKTSYTIKENISIQPLSQPKYVELKMLVKQYSDALQNPDADPSAEKVLEQIALLAGEDSAKFYSKAFAKYKE